MNCVHTSEPFRNIPRFELHYYLMAVIEPPGIHYLLFFLLSTEQSPETC